MCLEGGVFRHHLFWQDVFNVFWTGSRYSDHHLRQGDTGTTRRVGCRGLPLCLFEGHGILRCTCAVQSGCSATSSMYGHTRIDRTVTDISFAWFLYTPNAIALIPASSAAIAGRR